VAFELLREYRSDDVARAMPRASRDGPFFVGADRAACLVVAGPPSVAPSFPARQSLRWPSALPCPVADRRLPVDVFVRLRNGRFLYLGEARLTGCEGAAYAGGARMGLREPMPRDVWRELRAASVPPRPRSPCPEEPLLALRTDSPPQERLRALRAFVERWHGPGSDDEPPPSGARATVPAPLAELHRIVAGIPRATAQNRLIPAGDLCVEDGRIVFYVERQGASDWATEARGLDPPVWMRLNAPDACWEREEEPLSGFVVQLVVFEAVFGAPANASAAAIDPAVVSRLLERMAPLPLGAWRWPVHPTRLYARDSAFAVVSPNGPDFDVWLGSRHPEALDFIDEIVDVPWELVAF
jgi:hypothetical protein